MKLKTKNITTDEKLENSLKEICFSDSSYVIPIKNEEFGFQHIQEL